MIFKMDLISRTMLGNIIYSSFASVEVRRPFIEFQSGILHKEIDFTTGKSLPIDFRSG